MKKKLDKETRGRIAAMKRAGKVAEDRARGSGTKLWVMRNGKLVGINP